MIPFTYGIRYPITYDIIVSCLCLLPISYRYHIAAVTINNRAVACSGIHCSGRVDPTTCQVGSPTDPCRYSSIGNTINRCRLRVDLVEFLIFCRGFAAPRFTRYMVMLRSCRVVSSCLYKVVGCRGCCCVVVVLLLLLLLLSKSLGVTWKLHS